MTELSNIIDLYFVTKTKVIEMLEELHLETVFATICEYETDSEMLLAYQNECEIREMSYRRSNFNNKSKKLLKWISEVSNTIEYDDNIHNKVLPEINSRTKIPTDYNALSFQRQSVNKGYVMKQGLAAKSNDAMAKSLGYNPFSISITVSGYKSPLLTILANNPHIKAVFVESVDRLSRNLLLTINLLDYCAINKVKIYVGSNQMNRGIGKATLLLLAVFAEFELTSKQTSYSEDLLNVIKFEMDLIDYAELSDSELKLFNNLQFVEIDQVYEKALSLAYKYKTNYEKKTVNKAGNKKANNPVLYNNALEIIEILTE